MAKTTIRCPHCGTSFEIPAKTLLGVIGNVLGEDSGMGDVYLKEKADEPRKPLRDAKGHFVSPVTSEKFASDVATAANESIADEIREQGYVPNRHLFRRWITAQIFRLIRDTDRRDSFAGQVRSRGIKYMWKVIENEVKDIETIKKNGDVAEVARRQLWWNADTIYRIANDFLDDVVKQISKLKKHKCKGREYVTIPGFGDVFTDSIDSSIVVPIRKNISAVYIAEDAKNIIECCRALSAFKESSRWNIKMPTSFINAYKGAGAYFALRNLIMFHGCSVCGQKGADALESLDETADRLKNNGWQLVGLLKNVLLENNIDIDKKFAEWAEAKRKRLGK